MEVRRTLPVKLDVADSDRDALLDTITQYKHIANETSDHCWNDDGYKQTAKYAVKDELYHDLKAEHDLTANLVQQAIFQAVEAVKAGVERLEKERGHEPTRIYSRHRAVRQTRCHLPRRPRLSVHP